MMTNTSLSVLEAYAIATWKAAMIAFAIIAIVMFAIVANMWVNHPIFWENPTGGVTATIAGLSTIGLIATYFTLYLWKATR